MAKIHPFALLLESLSGISKAPKPGLRKSGDNPHFKFTVVTARARPFPAHSFRGPTAWIPAKEGHGTGPAGRRRGPDDCQLGKALGMPSSLGTGHNLFFALGPFNFVQC